MLGLRLTVLLMLGLTGCHSVAPGQSARDTGLPSVLPARACWAVAAAENRGTGHGGELGAERDPPGLRVAGKEESPAAASQRSQGGELHVLDFSLAHLNEQLVAGESHNQPDFGLITLMPDYNDLQRGKSAERRSGGTVEGR